MSPFSLPMFGVKGRSPRSSLVINRQDEETCLLGERNNPDCTTVLEKVLDRPQQRGRMMKRGSGKVAPWRKGFATR